MPKTNATGVARATHSSFRIGVYTYIHISIVSLSEDVPIETHHTLE